MFSTATRMGAGKHVRAHQAGRERTLSAIPMEARETPNLQTDLSAWIIEKTGAPQVLEWMTRRLVDWLPERLDER